MSKRLVRVPFRGIDRYSSIESIKDGALAIAHNARIVEGGGYRSVCAFEIERDIKEGKELTVVYKHPALPNDRYVGRSHNVFCIVYMHGDAIFQGSHIIRIPDEFLHCKIGFSSYGNLLFINFSQDNIPLEELTFVYSDNKYKPIDFSEILPPEPKSIICQYKFSADPAPHIPNKVATINFVKDANRNEYVMDSYDRTYLEILDDFILADFIHGAQYLIFAYKMFDGTVIKNSRIYPMDCEHESMSVPYSLFYKKESDLKMIFYKILSAIKPTITFEVPTHIKNNPLIESVVIYSTRNNPLYKLDNLNNDVDFNDPTIRDADLQNVGKVKMLSSRSILDKRNYDIPKTIFYEIAEVKFREEKSVTLCFSTHYRNIEQMPIFSPSMSQHKIISMGKFEYNARLHIYNTLTDFFKGEIVFRKESNVMLSKIHYDKVATPLGRIVFRYKILSGIEMINKEVSAEAALYRMRFPAAGSANPLYIIIPNLLTYPDVNAKSVVLFFEDSSGVRYFIKEFALKRSYANNYAYYQNLDGDKLSLHHPITVNLDTPIFEDEYLEKPIHQPNKLMISEVDNSFVYMPKHTLNIGVNGATICSVNVITDQLTESGFGLYPLYLFTDIGIYALESGKDGVLYSNIIKINNDFALNTSGTIAAADRVYFCSPKGLHSIQGRNTLCHSTFIKTIGVEGIAFDKYLKDCKLWFMPFYKEVLINNPKYNFSVIYNIDSDTFYTRDFVGTMVGNDTLIFGKKVLNPISKEDQNSPLFAELTSREIKLDSFESKRITRLIVRGERGVRFNLNLYGSNNASVWTLIGELHSSGEIRRTLASWRYFKVVVNDKKLSIDYIDIEYTDRFIGQGA